MSILSNTQENNLLLSMKGITFINPFIRQSFGQSPNELDVVNLSKKKLGKRLKKEINRKKKPFIVVVRNEQKIIEDVFLVPFEKKNDEIKVVMSCAEDNLSLIKSLV